jgi:hypothetical protein
LACPFFMPTHKLEDGGWLHPSRLPLGAGWSGTCSAPGHEGTSPADAELRESCNLGYAASCSRLPQQRSCDAVRFSVAKDRSTNLLLWFVCETAHLPSQHGTLEYDVTLAQWISQHPDPHIQKMAECYVESYLLRRIGSAPADFPVSPNS